MADIVPIHTEVPCGTIYICPVCKFKYRKGSSNLKCLVLHRPGDCCHYGDHKMSENTTKTRQVTPLPDTMKITQALATISDLEVNIVFIKREQTALARELREMTAKLNRLRLVLEAK